MPHKGEETSDLVCTPQTRERAARVLCALSDNNATTLRRRARVVRVACVFISGKGGRPVLLGKLRGTRSTHRAGWSGPVRH